jgi:hypothetical protein
MVNWKILLRSSRCLLSLPIQCLSLILPIPRSTNTNTCCNVLGKSGRPAAHPCCFPGHLLYGIRDERAIIMSTISYSFLSKNTGCSAGRRHRPADQEWKWIATFVKKVGPRPPHRLRTERPLGAANLNAAMTSSAVTSALTEDPSGRLEGKGAAQGHVEALFSPMNRIHRKIPKGLNPFRLRFLNSSSPALVISTTGLETHLAETPKARAESLTVSAYLCPDMPRRIFSRSSSEKRRRSRHWTGRSRSCRFGRGCRRLRCSTIGATGLPACMRPCKSPPEPLSGSLATGTQEPTSPSS